MRQRLGRGDVVLIPAGEVHACNPENDGRWSYQMLYLDPAWVEGVVGEMGTLDAVVLNRLPPELAPEQVHERLTRLNASLFSVAPDGDKEAALLLFVGDIFEAPWARIDVRDVPRDARRLQSVKEIIAARCAESLSLNDLAREAGMSRYHFVRAFSRVVGMTPHAWQLDRRIECARGLLEQGMSLAEAALQLGFADQSLRLQAARGGDTGGISSNGRPSAVTGAISFKTGVRTPAKACSFRGRGDNMAVWQQFLIIAGAHFLALLSPGPDFSHRAQRSGQQGACRERRLRGDCAGQRRLYRTGNRRRRRVAGGGRVVRGAQVGRLRLSPVGWRFLTVRDETLAPEAEARAVRRGSWWRECRVGFLSGILNPKNSLFYASLFSLGFERDTTFGVQLAYGVWMFAVVLLWDLCIARAAGIRRSYAVS